MPSLKTNSQPERLQKSIGMRPCQTSRDAWYVPQEQHDPQPQKEYEPEPSLPAIVQQYDTNGMIENNDYEWPKAVRDYEKHILTTPQIRQIAAYRGQVSF